MGAVLPGPRGRLVLTMPGVAGVVGVVAGVVMVMVVIVVIPRVVGDQLWRGRGSAGVPRHVYREATGDCLKQVTIPRFL